MGLERFKTNFQEVVRRVFDDRDFILGRVRADRSPEAHVDSVWPDAREDRMREIYQRVLEIMQPPSLRATGYGTIERNTKLREFQQSGAIDLVYRKMIEKERQRAGKPEPVKDRDDGNDLLVTVTKSGLTGKAHPPKEEAEAGCLYINYMQEDPVQIRAMVSIAIAEALYGTPRVNSFKIAGPHSNAKRRDALVLYLDRQGIKDKVHLWEDKFKGLCTLIPETCWGAQEIVPGVGFTRQPRSPDDKFDWKWNYTEVFSDFAHIMACYLARGIWENSGSLEDYCCCVERWMKFDGIDPLHPNLLSRTTRQGDALLMPGASGAGV